MRALERDAKTERDLLESYLAKYREASARDNINAAPPEARIISRASPSIKPDYPKKVPTVLIAAFAAFALSAGFTVTGALLGAPAASPYCLRLCAADGLCSTAGLCAAGDAGAAFGAANAASAPGRAGNAAAGRRRRPDGCRGEQRRADCPQLAPGGGGRPSYRYRRQHAQRRHNLCRHFAGARAGAAGKCGAGRFCLRRAQSVGDFDRAAGAWALPN